MCKCSVLEMVTWFLSQEMKYPYTYESFLDEYLAPDPSELPLS